MKKTLIYWNENDLIPKGGPAGYLYNLNQELERTKLPISFMKGKNKIKLEEFRKYFPKRILDLRRAYIFSKMIKVEYPLNKELLEYDILHFHSVEQLYFNRETLDKYKGKVVLTSHSPCAKHKEFIDRLNPKDYRRYKEKLDKLSIIDEYAFNRADYIIFPCEEAEEPYFNTWIDYKRIKENNSGKYKYIPTGIQPVKAIVDSKFIRNKYNIPDDAFVVSYVGRHNDIKGYDNLKKIGEILLKNENVWFIIAGAKGPIAEIKHERWIEVGWTNDPHSIINSADVFILPNKETYFDLVLLEVISLGKMVLISETGGNKYFKKFKSPGILFYENIDEAILQINKINRLSKDEKNFAGTANKLLFQSNFTSKVFAEKYIDFLEEISNQNN